MSGRFKVQVVDAATGSVVEDRPWQNNLILDAGLNFIGTAVTWISQITYGVAGTGNTPTKDLPDPGDLFSQAGTTVTRDSGTRDFSAGDVGKLLRFASGEEAYVTALIGVTSVTVGTSQTVTSGAVDALYRVAQTGLTAEQKRTNTYPEFTDDEDGLASQWTSQIAATGKITHKRTYDFSEEVGSVNYTEVGVSASATVASNLFSRMLLAGAVTVGIGQLLRLKYQLTIAVAGHAPATQTTIDGGITGWPLPYNISSIVSNGTYWDVTLNESHHFLAGGKFNINGAKRPRTTITVAASTAGDFTLTAPGHGRIGGDSIIVEGMTPSGYNGTFTVASVAGDDIVVTSVLNPGPGTVFGNLRQAEPGTWYDGADYTIASIPSAAVVRITNATSIAAAGLDGTGYNNTKRKFVAVNYGQALITGHSVTSKKAIGGVHYNTSGDSTSFTDGGIQEGYSGNVIRLTIPPDKLTDLPDDFPQWWGYAATFNRAHNVAGSSQSPVPTTTWGGGTASGTESAYTAGTFYRDTTVAFVAGNANYSTINAVCVSRGSLDSGQLRYSVQGYILFEEPQRKKNTYKLTLTFRRSWGRDLTAIPL